MINKIEVAKRTHVEAEQTRLPRHGPNDGICEETSRLCSSPIQSDLGTASRADGSRATSSGPSCLTLLWTSSKHGDYQRTQSTDTDDPSNL